MVVTLGLPVAVPVKLTEHLPFDNAQFAELNVPGPAVEKVTLPVAVTGVPESVSATIAVHVEARLMRTGVAHDIEVEVELGVTAMQPDGLWVVEGSGSPAEGARAVALAEADPVKGE